MFEEKITSAVNAAIKGGFNIHPMDGKLGENIDPHLLYQAGIDCEGTPILVFTETFLPDPEVISHDQLFLIFKKKLNFFVKNDYILVYFANNKVKEPSFPWLLNAYNELERKFKKNIKRMFIVHPSSWTRMVLNFFSTIISPKFYSKLYYAENLEALKAFIPVDSIDIPQTVIRHDSTLELNALASASVPSIDTVVSDKHSIFGAEISDIIFKVPSSDIYKLPLPVVDLMLYLHKVGAFTDDIFRHSCYKINLKQIKSQTTHSSNIFKIIPEDLREDPHISALLLKVFFLELSPPVFTPELIDAVLSLPVVTSKTDLEDITFSISHTQKKISHIKSKILTLIPKEYRILLLYLFSLLNKIAQSSTDTNMQAFDLAEVWAPILFRRLDGISNNSWLYLTCVSPGLPSVGTVVHIMIQYFYSIFSNEIRIVLNEEYVHGETLMDKLVESLKQQQNLYRG
ncbi:hypothetical protein BB560_001347 [Smittium megazygosporum]|uniref:Rho-GAP domain-containing protein n=1 Tax=Smittium megazygosporum TaxID=133381 RepID=A0A2T9ZHV3_9FUNG|nr:hypothetical protein BB560_001347 [Smittium megazygosporum]